MVTERKRDPSGEQFRYVFSPGTRIEAVGIGECNTVGEEFLIAQRGQETNAYGRIRRGWRVVNPRGVTVVLNDNTEARVLLGNFFTSPNHAQKVSKGYADALIAYKRPPSWTVGDR